MNTVITKDPLNNTISTNNKTSFLDTITNTIKNTVKSVNDNISNVANTVSSNASNVANTVSSNVSNVANTVSKDIGLNDNNNNNAFQNDMELIQNDIDKITQSVDNNINPDNLVENDSNSDITIFGFIKYFFIGCVIILLGTNYYYHVQTGKNLIQTLFGKLFEYFAKLFKLDIFQSPMKSNLNLLNSELLGRANKNSVNNKIYDDKSRTRTMLGNTKKAGNYCYIGEENGYRSCTRVDQANKCTSNKLYPTLEMCKRPNTK